jgi:hypothetical protein
MGRSARRRPAPGRPDVELARPQRIPPVIVEKVLGACLIDPQAAKPERGQVRPRLDMRRPGHGRVDLAASAAFRRVMSMWTYVRPENGR